MRLALAFTLGLPHIHGMAYQFTSLHGSIEKLLEAEYFLAGLTVTSGSEFGYNLNAFLSACRSVTFVMQKSFSHVPGFSAWYANCRSRMKSDRAMGFFLELRNISQHEGPVSYVGGSIPYPPGWTYRFAGNREAVPTELLGRDIALSCAQHLAKIAEVVDRFRMAFPQESCMHSALTREGMERLGFSLDDVGYLLGLPEGYLEVGGQIPLEEKLRVLRREFDPIDVEALGRLVDAHFRRAGEDLVFADTGGADLTDDIARLVERGGDVGRVPRMVFLSAIGRRIQEIDGI